MTEKFEIPGAKFHFGNVFAPINTDLNDVEKKIVEMTTVTGESSIVAGWSDLLQEVLDNPEEWESLVELNGDFVDDLYKKVEKSDKTVFENTLDKHLKAIGYKAKNEQVGSMDKFL